MDQLTWGMPGEGIYFPAEILPLLDGTPQGDRLREYISAERGNFPPEKMAHLPVDQGARREQYTIVPEFHIDLVNKEIKERNFHVTQGLIPVESVYSMARYYELFPDERKDLQEAWPGIQEILLRQMSWGDWAGMGWFLRPYMSPWHGQGGVMEANEWAAAMIGLAKITDMLEKPEAHALAIGLLAKALAFRHGLAHYHLYAYDSGMLEIPADRGPDWLVKDSAGSWFPTMFTYEWTEPAHDGRQAYMFNEFGLNLLMSVGSRGLAPAFRGMVPELGRFLRDYAQGACANFVRRVELNSPEWFMAYAELPIGRDSVNYMLPEESHQLFLAHAWILRSKPDKIEGLLDVPWVPLGDFYYLHKLAETIKAYQGWEWE